MRYNNNIISLTFKREFKMKNENQNLNLNQDIINKMNDMIKNNESKSKINGMLSFIYELNSKDIKLYQNAVYGNKFNNKNELLNQKAELIVKNYYSKSKDELIKLMCEINGTYNSNQHYYNNLKLSFAMINFINDNNRDELINFIAESK